jgi:hypothetical protein
MNALQAFAQGARCGHIEGKGRAGQYVIGEEEDRSYEAADAQKLSCHLHQAWAGGYRTGYVLALEGKQLPPELENG